MLIIRTHYVVTCVHMTYADYMHTLGDYIYMYNTGCYTHTHYVVRSTHMTHADYTHTLGDYIYMYDTG